MKKDASPRRRSSKMDGAGADEKPVAPQRHETSAPPTDALQWYRARFCVGHAHATADDELKCLLSTWAKIQTGEHA